jgi:hypothetical protein
VPGVHARRDGCGRSGGWLRSLVRPTSGADPRTRVGARLVVLLAPGSRDGRVGHGVCAPDGSYWMGPLLSLVLLHRRRCTHRLRSRPGRSRCARSALGWCGRSGRAGTTGSLKRATLPGGDGRSARPLPIRSSPRPNSSRTFPNQPDSGVSADAKRPRVRGGRRGRLRSGEAQCVTSLRRRCRRSVCRERRRGRRPAICPPGPRAVGRP